MSSINNIYLKKETLETLLKGINAKGENGIAIDISISDEPNSYNQNVSAFVSQSKEDREAKKARYYIGNGRTIWTDGTIKAIPYKDTNAPQPETDMDGGSSLPF